MDSYEKFFEIIPVETAEQLTESFRLRYEVYCVENAFEDPAQNPNSMETDSCDARALHSLLRRRGSDRVLGTVRLILPLPEPRMKGIGLPIQDVCEHELLQGDNSALPWASTAEISRFAVSKKLRSRATEEPAEHFTQSLPGARRDIHYASLGLMQAIVAMAANSGVTHLCAVMEPCLLRMLSRLGIHFTSLGPHVGFHGLRQPCYSELDVMAARTWVERHDVWRILTRDGALWPINRPLAESFGGRTQSAAIAIHA
jgi:N-acyl amino acid synthase of PEP-CTERM/exosortase system